MARIIGVNLPDEKKIDYALTLLYGVGWSRAQNILNFAKVSKEKKVKDLTEEELKRIIVEIEKKYKVEGNLRQEIAENIKRLKNVACYRGLRHGRSLPVRGQRTKSNARTKRGRRKTVGALKKEDAARGTVTRAIKEAALKRKLQPLRMDLHTRCRAARLRSLVLVLLNSSRR